MAIHRSNFGLSASTFTQERSLLGVFLFENFGRSLIAGAIPLQGLAVLGGDSGSLSLAYLAAAALAVVALVFSPLVCKYMSRRQLFMISVMVAAASNLLFLIPLPGCFFMALTLRSIAAGLLLATITMYFLEKIPKAKLSGIEASKAVLAASTWLIGPVLGIWLWNNVATELPFFIAVVLSCLSGLIFLISGVSNSSIQPPCHTLGMLLRSYRDFFASFQMLASYLIEVGKALFWVALFYYLPLYVLAADLPVALSGIILSASVVGLFAAPVLSRIVDRFSVEMVLIGSFIWSGVLLCILFLLPSENTFGLILILIAGLGVNVLDYVGHLPFLKRVPAEREPEFTVVFSTWRDVATLLTPLLALIVLPLGSLNLLFGFIGVVLLASILLVLFLPNLSGDQK